MRPCRHDASHLLVELAAAFQPPSSATVAALWLFVGLEDDAAPPNGIFVLFPQRKHLPLRVRLWIDHLRHHYEQPQFWKTGAPA